MTSIIEENELSHNKLVFSLKQYGGYAEEEIESMDVIRFYQTLSMLNEKAETEKQIAEQRAQQQYAANSSRKH